MCDINRVQWEMFAYWLSPFKVALGSQGLLFNSVVHFMGDVSLFEASARGRSRCIKGVKVWIVSV